MTGYDAKSIGRRVAAYRRAANMTAEQLAEAVGGGLTRTAVAKLENGHRVEVSTELLVQLSWALHVPPLNLLMPLEEPFANIAVGNMASTTEGLGYWLLGVDLPDSEVGGASVVANAVHNQYRILATAMIDMLTDVIRLVDAQDGKGGSHLDEMTRATLNRAVSERTLTTRASREVLAILRSQLGLDDG
jgi:transcriptional regulator with XRE-family HTH domain